MDVGIGKLQPTNDMKPTNDMALTDDLEYATHRRYGIYNMLLFWNKIKLYYFPFNIIKICIKIFKMNFAHVLFRISFQKWFTNDMLKVKYKDGELAEF